MTHNEVVKIDGVEYEAQFEVEPAQKGVWEDESWPTHVTDLVVFRDDNLIDYNGISEDGVDYTELYSDIEKHLNKKLLERDL